MPITPDTRDWTWVLDRPCPECGFDTRTVSADAVPALVRANVAAWSPVLADTDRARRRPHADVWSPLEYACHVRDVFRIFRGRLLLMLVEDDPLFPNWDQDVTAVEDRYASQDPLIVAGELAVAGESIAAAFAQVPPDAWQRPGRRGDGASFTVGTFARYFVHDPIHHLHDVRPR